VGTLEGDPDGSGVGVPIEYVGASEGEVVGAREGDEEGRGVVCPERYEGSGVG